MIQTRDPGWVELPDETLWPMDQEKPGYRLLTEAEWEVVCRSGTSGSYSFGEDKKWLGKYGWFLETSGDWSHPIGQLRPNPRGLFDIHGNLNEWCYDWYGDYDSGKLTNPQGPKRGSDRVYRGGAGTAARGHAGRRTAAGTRLTSGTATWAFVCSAVPSSKASQVKK